MAWISQLVPVMPVAVIAGAVDEAIESANLKVGAAILEKVTQVHLLLVVIPVAGRPTVLVADAPVVNSTAMVLPSPHMTLAYGQPTWASSFLLLVACGMTCWAFRVMLPLLWTVL